MPNNTVTQRGITVGATEGDLSSITSGLTQGETVVTDGVDKLQPGAKVTTHMVTADGVERSITPRNESFAAIHPQADRDHPADGGDPARRPGGIQTVAGLGAARGRLSHHPGADVLSGREPRCDGVVGDGAAGAAVRAGARAQPDDLEQLVRKFGHHAAVRPEPQHRCRRAGSAGSHQRGGDLSADRPAQSSRLQQDQSGRRADPDAGADLDRAAAGPGRGPRRYAAVGKDFAGVGRRAGEYQRRAEALGTNPGESDPALGIWAHAGGPAHGGRGLERQSGEGKLRREGSRPTPSARTISCYPRRTIGHSSSPTKMAPR